MSPLSNEVLRFAGIGSRKEVMAEVADQRRYVRVPVERPAYVTTPTEMRKSKSVWSHDLGEGGCLLVNEDAFGVGRVLIVDIVLDTHQPVRAIGQIRHEYRDVESRICSGFEFQHIASDHVERLKTFLESRTSFRCMAQVVGNA